MLSTLKKMLSKKIEEKGTLKVQNEAFNDVSLCAENDKLTFKGCNLSALPISELSDIQPRDGSFTFICDNKKFWFESKKNTELFRILKQLVPSRTIFNSNRIVYYVYNTENRKFELYDQPCEAKIVHDSEYYLRIEDEASIQHYEQINTNTQYYMDQSNHSFVWSVYNKGMFHTFCIEFEDHINFLEFVSKYTECCYKSVNEGDQFKYFENMAVMNPVQSQQDTNIPEDKEEEWMEFEDEKPKDTEFNRDTKANEHLVIGNDLVFVTRGSSLGVFDTQQNDLKFRTHIQKVLNDPQKIITHNQNQSLLVLDRGQRDKLQVLDLNKGEVVEKWDIKEEMNDYFDSVKYNNEGTLVGMTDHSLFRIDPRMKDKVAEKNTYKTKNEFSCGIATETGDVAVASRKGDLRLYNKIDKRAKSLLPGFGDEILGIDSSKDGTMILCTCKNYILVFAATSDYSKSIGKNKPTPKRLQLKPQHLSLIKDEVSFIPAKFDQDDTMIVTSTGRFVVKWRVKDVKAGNLYDYSLKALYDVIVDENFVFKGEDIIVALPNDVKKVTEQELRRPK
ncbi:uncharacterized protein VICG_01004 [Vittaforma corneae ATCC 50505]|uniref:Uncharacterized protein n=1 Tax=Vittaforma corneae (strain ATCC 50505) TaxID=993615 RepID=L2GNT7_VITCO|nr:uncharacterized protein VICG_01004 [Vittaforma corneae ATCC 50505]ELA41987.1 hypothetical protein VICG_01004 [Vittaforma corneae ATCC 50505]